MSSLSHVVNISNKLLAVSCAYSCCHSVFMYPQGENLEGRQKKKKSIASNPLRLSEKERMCKAFLSA